MLRNESIGALLYLGKEIGRPKAAEITIDTKHDVCYLSYFFPSFFDCGETVCRLIGGGCSDVDDTIEYKLCSASHTDVPIGLQGDMEVAAKEVYDGMIDDALSMDSRYHGSACARTAS